MPHIAGILIHFFPWINYNPLSPDCKMQNGSVLVLKKLEKMEKNWTGALLFYFFASKTEVQVKRFFRCILTIQQL
jgi:hypothetical protein